MTSFMNLFKEEDRKRYESELRSYNILNQVRHMNKRGQTIFVDIHVARTEYLGAEVLLASTSDITERLMAEQQLIQASKMTTLGEMATGIAHELNQPLSVIKTASSFFRKKLSKNEVIADDVLKSLAEEVESQVDRAAKVINHLREFGRKSGIQMELVNVNDVLHNALQVFSQQLKLREISVIMELAEDLPCVLADANRLEQVFINLLINARDSIEEKCGESSDRNMEKKITLKTISRDGLITIEIGDTGKGIAQSIREKVFEPFFTTKEVGKGTGIGLSISYSIIQDYHGTIHVESEEGAGANFIIRFPVAV